MHPEPNLSIDVGNFLDASHRSAMETIGGLPPITDNKPASGEVGFLVVVVVLTLLSTVSVVLRFLSRRVSKLVWWDDWTSLAALFFAYGYFITFVVGITVAHAGYHFARFSIPQAVVLFKTEFAGIVTYDFSITLSNCSLLLFYSRVFTVRTMRIWINIFHFLVAVYFIQAIFVSVFTTSPVRAQWEFWLPHTSIHLKAYWISSGVYRFFIDLGLLVLPQPVVWKLKLPLRRKIMLSILLLLGVLWVDFSLVTIDADQNSTCAASILKMIYIINVDFTDPSYSTKWAAIWTLIELDLSIICGCGPSFPHLFQHWLHGTRWSSWRSQSGSPLYSKADKSSSSGTSNSDFVSNKPAPERHSYHDTEEGKYVVHVQTDVDIVQVERGDGEEHATRGAFDPRRR